MPTIKPKYIIEYNEHTYSYYVAKGCYVFGGEKYRGINDTPIKAQKSS